MSLCSNALKSKKLLDYHKSVMSVPDVISMLSREEGSSPRRSYIDPQYINEILKPQRGN